MITIAWVCLLLATGAAASVCSTDHYRRYGDACTCSDICLDNTQCQLNQTGDYSCQCLPCLTYDPVLRQCVAVVATTTEAPATTTRGPNCRDYVAADIFYLADSSNSIYPVGWNRQLAFIVNTARAFRLGPKDVQAGLAIFSTDFVPRINLDTYTDIDQFEADVLSTPQLRQLTYTYEALNAINRDGYLTSPARGARPGVPKVLIVITDGQSENITKTLQAAEDLRRQNITILSIGVGVTNLVELQGIASRPELVFSVKNFAALDSISDQITGTICEVPVDPIDPCDASVQVDLAFVVDDSSTIAPDVFERNFEFVFNVVRGFHLDESSTKVALLTYSTTPYTVFRLTASADQVYQTLLNVPYENGTTNTHLALEVVAEFFSPGNGGRQAAKKAVVLLTDARSSDPTRTALAAQQLKARGVSLFTLGIQPGADRQELTDLASNQAYSFEVSSYNQLVSFASSVARLICIDPEPTTTTPEPTTTTPEPTTTTPEPTTTTPEPTTTTPEPTTERNICESDDNPCQDICTNTPQGPVCSCNNGSVVVPSDPTRCKEPTCEDALVADIYYLVDSSNSIFPVGWNRALSFVVNTANAFNLGPNAVQLAFGVFSTQFLNIITLDQYTDHQQFNQEVLSTPQLKELTFTFDALNAINREGYLTSPQYGARPGVPKVLIVITDGQSDSISRTLAESEALRRQNITILSIGVGLQNLVELQGIAGTPDNVFSVKNFGALDSIRDLITRRVCDAPSFPDPPCSSPDELDLVVLVDASSNIGQDVFAHNFEFVGGFVRGFNLGETSTKVALVTYSTSPQVVFSLTSSIDNIYQTLVSVPFNNGSSNTHLALRAALNLLQPAVGGRPKARKGVVLITDRESTDHETTFQVANEIKAQGINIFTLGVQPTADSLELTGLASRVPYNFPVPNYSKLVSFASKVAQVICVAPPAPPPVVPCPPFVEVDFFFVVDSSGSIGIEKYNFNFEFIARILTAYTIGENATKVSLLTYGTSVRPRFALSADQAFIEAQLKNVPYQGSTTNTHLGLRYVINGGYNDPARGARPGARKVLILITDGLSSDPPQTLLAAQEVKDQNITIAVVGVGRLVDTNEIYTVATKPEFVVTPDDYDALENFASSVAGIACNNTNLESTL